jgi:4-diphosphocytidyl-2-C-methyl-D-erythritol kinase
VISLGWPAPAKLNLFLHITGQRQDGYHLLQTVFQFIQLIDVIDFTILESGLVRRSSISLKIDERDDLVIKAAQKIKKRSGSKLGVDISVKKNIPIGGGLGGGSSDAATTLVALNELWQTGLSIDELSEIGLSLGADIPFFINGNAAWAEGVGDKLTPINLDECFYLVIYPNCGISTKAVFEASDLTRNTPRITIRDFRDGNGKNDCESYVRNHYHDVTEALDWLGEYASSKLTGTGACLFAQFSDENEANEVKYKLPTKWQGYVVKGINKSPLLGRLIHEKTRE